MVAVAHSRLSAASTRRGRTDPTSTAGDLHRAYGYANAEKTSPSSVGVSPRSFRIVGPATEMFTRSMYADEVHRAQDETE